GAASRGAAAMARESCAGHDIAREGRLGTADAACDAGRRGGFSDAPTVQERFAASTAGGCLRAVGGCREHCESAAGARSEGTAPDRSARGAGRRTSEAGLEGAG